MQWRQSAGYVLVVALAIVAPARADTMHFYSYDPGDTATRAAAGPVTLQVRKGLLHATVLNLRSTEAEATADLKPASPGSLGPGGLAGVTGVGSGERSLYAVGSADQGEALINALCPGAKRGWMALGKVGVNQDLSIAVIGQTPGQPPRLCHALAYSFHGAAERSCPA
jgi:hypothetical protein